jgi:hypothetical protein
MHILTKNTHIPAENVRILTENTYIPDGNVHNLNKITDILTKKFGYVLKNAFVRENVGATACPRPLF